MIEKMKQKVILREVFKPHYSEALENACSYEIQLDLGFGSNLYPILYLFTYYDHPKSMKIAYNSKIVDLHKDKYNNLILRIYEVS